MKKIFKYTLFAATLLLSQINRSSVLPSAWSNVYITNNTPLTLELSTKVSGKTKQLTKGKHYKVITTKIKPWTREIGYKINRTKLPTTTAKKTDFHFFTTVAAKDKNNKQIGGPITLYFLVKSNWRGIITPPSFIRKKSIRVGKAEFDKHGLISLGGGKVNGIKIATKNPWRFSGEYGGIMYKNKPVDVHMDAYLEGGRVFQDQEFIFSLRPFTGAKFDENKNILRVLTYNIFLRPLMIFPFEGQGERAKIIPSTIPGIFEKYLPDIVAFNEVFEGFEKKLGISTYKSLVRGMKKIGYTYYTKVVGTGKIGKTLGKKGEGRHWRTVNGGVVVFSKWPIVTTKEIVFSKCSGPDCWAAKGVIYTKIDKNGKIYHIFSTHLNAGQSWRKEKSIEKQNYIKKRNEDMRTSQLRELYNFIEAQKIPQNEPVILAGDFNVKKFDIETTAAKKPITIHYKKMIKELNATHPKHKPQSTNPKGWWLDYVFYHKKYQKPIKSSNTPLGYGIYIQKPWLTMGKGFDQIINLFKSKAMQEMRSEVSDHYPVLGVFEFDK